MRSTFTKLMRVSGRNPFKRESRQHVFSFWLLFFLIISLTGFGQVAPKDAAGNQQNFTVSPSTFNIDGFLVRQGSAGDWIDDIFDNAGEKKKMYAFHYIDLVKSASDNVFTSPGTNKTNDNPSNWTWGSETASDKGDLNHALVYIANDQTGNTWGMFSADRQKNEGATIIEFEFLQKEIKLSGLHNFTTDASSTTGGRTVGDIMVSLTFNSTNSIAYYKWDWDVTAGKYKYLEIAPGNNNAFGAVNGTPFTAPYNTYSYASGMFIEGAINITALFNNSNIGVGCASANYLTLFIKSKAGAGNDPSLADFVEPIPFRFSINSASISYNTVCDNISNKVVPVQWAAGSIQSGTFSSSDLGNALNTVNGNVNITGLVPGTYHITYSYFNNCNQQKTATATITINGAPNPPSFSTPIGICNTAPHVSDLPFPNNGNSYNWYTASTGGTALASTASITTGTYYVSESNTNCESGRTEIQINVGTKPDAPSGDAAQTFCNSGKVSGLSATGSNIKWYNASNELLTSETDLVNGAHYYATQTVSGCESVGKLDVTVTINKPDAPSGDAAQTFCNSGKVSGLSATGSNIKWYNASNELLTSETDLVNGAHYYATQTVSGCESVGKLDVTVTINKPDAPSGDAAQTFCNSGKVSGLSATGSNIKWYNASNELLTSETDLVNGAHYYATQTVSGCESVGKLDVTVTINKPDAPSGDAAQTFCNSGKVSGLSATGSNIKWYNASNELLTSETDLVNGAHYYATQTVSGCESVGKLDVTVTINKPDAPSGDAAQTFCNSGKVSGLSATGSNIKWYNASNELLTSETDLVNGAHYYATQTVSGCESVGKLDVTVTINKPDAPSGDAAQTFCNSGKVSGLSATGSNIKWYNASNELLTSETDLVNGAHYYATQTVSGCESVGKLDVTVTINKPDAPSGDAAQTFCNSGKVSGLSATGSNIKWYNASNELLTSETDLVNGAHYYATQTVSGCESVGKLDVTVTINKPDAPSGDAAQTFCNSGKVSGLSATGSNIKWYNASNELLTSETDLVNGAHYYATQTVSGCESVGKLDVTVTINKPDAPSGDAAQTFCNSGKVSGLSATGSNIKWYNASNELLTSETDLVNGAHYYATQTVSGCESVGKLDVTVTINKPDAPSGDAAQTFCNSGKVSGLSATGSNIKWYNASNELLTSETDLVNGAHYYATQTVSGCESVGKLDVTVTINQSPQITANPAASQIVCIGGSVTLSVTATGTNPAYQWYKGSTNDQNKIVGATLSTYTINPVSISNAADYYVVASVVGCSGTATSTASILMVPEVKVEAISPAPSSQTPIPSQQYSDKVTFTGTIYNGASLTATNKTVTFKVKDQEMGTVALGIIGPDLTAKLENTQLVEGIISGGNMQPGIKAVSAVFKNQTVQIGCIPTAQLNITQEDAVVINTSPNFVSGCAGCKTNILLTASIKDISTAVGNPDVLPGNIKNAQVRFIISPSSGSDITSTWTNVGLVNPGDSVNGVASYLWSVTIPSSSSEVYTVRIQVGNDGNGYYIADGDADPLTIASSTGVDFITGGGYIISPVNSNVSPITNSSAGLYPSSPNTKTNFGFNIKWNKSVKNLQGNVNIIYRRWENGRINIYQIKSTSLSSTTAGLSIDARDVCAKKAILTCKANVMNLTTGIGVGSGVSLKMSITDKGEPGLNDEYGVTVMNGNTLLFATNWVSTQNVDIKLNGGNIVVHSGADCKTINTIQRSSASEVLVQEASSLNVTSNPNPSSGQFNLRVYGNASEQLSLKVFDLQGRVVEVKNNLLSGQTLTIGAGYKPGLYMVELMQGNKRKQIKLIKL